MTDEHVETGLVEAAAEITATVKDEPAPGLTSAGVDALKAMVSLPQNFGAPQMVALARDIGMNIYPIGTILSNHGLKNAQYEFLQNHNEFFRNSVIQQANEWQGLKSTQDRLRAEAAAALEEKMPGLANRMGNAGEKLADAVEAAKLFAKIAGVDGDAQGARRGGEGFTITIDLGADTRVTVGTNGTAPANADAHLQPPLRTDGEGQGQQSPLSHQPQGQGGMREVRQVGPRQIAAPASGPIPEG